MRSLLFLFIAGNALADRPLLIIDFGCRNTALIADKIRSLGKDSVIKPRTLTQEEFVDINPLGIILSGGPASIYEKGSPQIPTFLIDSKIPLLGICYGMQALAYQNGAEVSGSHSIEKGPTYIWLHHKNNLFKGLKKYSLFWMSHKDHVTQIPPNYIATASSLQCTIAAMEHKYYPFYAVQFHPEMSGKVGEKILENFIHLCHHHESKRVIYFAILLLISLCTTFSYSSSKGTIRLKTGF